MSKSAKVIAVILLVLILDQSLKIWIKTTMEYGDEIPLIGDWAKLNFVENPGMAFGLTFGGDWGKLGLSLFRIIAVVFLSYYIKKLIDSKVSTGLLISFGLILAGALGNIIDSVFYGMIFSESPYHGGLAELFPEEGGYAGFLHGKVVDMLYFPLVEGNFPEWLPRWGGDRFLFFRPVFNIADMSITIGVASIILFHRDFFSGEEETKDKILNKAITTVSELNDADQKGLIDNAASTIDESTTTNGEIEGDKTIG